MYAELESIADAAEGLAASRGLTVAAGEKDGQFAHLNSLPFRLALFFAINPDESLSVRDISIKYGVTGPTDNDTIRNVRARLRNAVQQGIFVYSSDGPGRGKMGEYTAGPVLLSMVGGKLQREMIAACMPVRVVRISIRGEG